MVAHKSLIGPIMPIMAQDAVLLFSFPWEPGIQKNAEEYGGLFRIGAQFSNISKF